MTTTKAILLGRKEDYDVKITAATSLLKNLEEARDILSIVGVLSYKEIKSAPICPFAIKKGLSQIRPMIENCKDWIKRD